MKKMIFYAAVLLFAACNNKKTKNTDAAGTSAAAPADMPYTMEKPYRDWQPGDPKNAVTVAKMLKAWETKNVDECASYFADSSLMVFDNYRGKLSMDSLKTFLAGSLADYASVKIKLEDWESVTSGDKSEEWVSVWYTQSWVDKKGVADSVNVIDDAKLENGKITVFSEYLQHFPAAKKK